MNEEKLKATLALLKADAEEKSVSGNFPGSPVAKTPSSQFRGPGFHP